MPAIQVEPDELPSAAVQLMAFAAAFLPWPAPVALPPVLQDAVGDYWRAWAAETTVAATAAREAASAVLAAADLYRQLEVLLVPRALR